MVCAAVVFGVCNGFAADGDERRAEKGPGLEQADHMRDSQWDSAEQWPDGPTGSLTLVRAIEFALLGSPHLEAFSWDIRAAEARALQAGLRPNPELSIEMDEVRWRPGPEAVTRIVQLGGTIDVERRTERRERSGFSDAEITIQISQDIELGRKRAKRTRLAERERRVAAWDYEVAKAEVLAQTSRDFVEVLALQERLQLAEEPIRHAKQLLDDVRRAALPVPVLNRARVGLSESEMERERTRRDLDAARVRLASAWGSTQPRFDRVAGQLATIRPVPSEAELLQRIDRNPEIVRWAAELDARTAAVAVEKASAVPDLEVTVAFKTDRLRTRHARGIGLRPDRFEIERRQTAYDRTRDNTLLLEFSIPLPLFDRNQGAIREARCLVSRADAESRAVQVRVRTELLTLRAALAAAFADIERLGNEVIPATSETLDAVKKGIQLGGFTYFDLVDVIRDLHDARQDRLDALLTYHQTVADLERLLGAPLAGPNVDSRADCP